MSNKIAITDAYDVMSKKILINRMSMECLQHQIAFSENSIKFQKLTKQVAEKKLKLINELNTLFEKQLSTFDELRHKECMLIYDEINELDTPTAEHNKLINELKKHEEAMFSLMPKIQHIESTIPNEQSITNYAIKNPVNVAASCNEEVDEPWK